MLYRRIGTPLLSGAAVFALAAVFSLGSFAAGAQNPASAQPGGDATIVANDQSSPVLTLGAGDQIGIQVYGRPEFGTTTYVADDGTVSVPLAGAVQVAGMSPSAASSRVASALRDGQFLVNPQVTIVLSQFRSQQVSVLGEVKSPARFAIESKTTILDLLAQAGGITESGSDVIYMIRPSGNNRTTRYPIDLTGLADGTRNIPTLVPRGGDVIYVPKASRFYIYGEVQAPNMYKLEPGMTVLQAISRSGGITQRGSDRRIQIKRRAQDGTYQTLAPALTDRLEPDDVVHVKERLF